MSEYKIEDYINYRLQRANETLAEVEIHIKNKFWNTAVNRLYYSCFYAVSALLIKYGVETASHSGAKQKFNQLFIKTGKIDIELGKRYSELLEKRHKGDYNDFYDFDEETVIRLLAPSQKLIKRIEELIKENSN